MHRPSLFVQRTLDRSLVSTNVEASAVAHVLLDVAACRWGIILWLGDGPQGASMTKELLDDEPDDRAARTGRSSWRLAAQGRVGRQCHEPRAPERDPADRQTPAGPSAVPGPR